MTHSDPQRGSTLRRRALVALGGLVVLAAFTGCSSATAEPPRSSPTTGVLTVPTVPTATPVPTATTAIARSTASAAGSATVTAITAAYLKFFNPGTSLQESVTLLQDGPAFRDTLRKQAKTSFAKTTTATVSTVTLDSPNKATVVYTILISGTPVLVNTTGSAVHESGTWKVAGETFCGLLTAQGPPPPICAQARATSAPH